MKGLNIVLAEEGIIVETNRIGTMLLKAKDRDQEIIHVHVKAGKNVTMNPYHCEGAMFSCFIIKGKLMHTSSQQQLLYGDCFSVKDLEGSEHFKVLEDSELLFITNKRYFEKQVAILRQFTDQMSVIQEKDDYTEQHCDRVGSYANRIAIKLGISDQELEDIVYVAKVHDIGKIKISDEILNKPGKLNAGELQQMKKHPLFGYEIVKHAFSEAAAKIVLWHHERLDGQGYPYGLKGDEIPMNVRIVTLADSFDAMMSNRPYRPALSLEQTLAEIEAGLGTIYDESVFEALKKVLKEDGLLI